MASLSRADKKMRATVMWSCKSFVAKYVNFVNVPSLQKAFKVNSTNSKIIEWNVRKSDYYICERMFHISGGTIEWLREICKF